MADMKDEEKISEDEAGKKMIQEVLRSQDAEASGSKTLNNVHNNRDSSNTNDSKKKTGSDMHKINLISVDKNINNEEVRKEKKDFESMGETSDNNCVKRNITSMDKTNNRNIQSSNKNKEYISVISEEKARFFQINKPSRDKSNEKNVENTQNKKENLNTLEIGINQDKNTGSSNEEDKKETKNTGNVENGTSKKVEHKAQFTTFSPVKKMISDMEQKTISKSNIHDNNESPNDTGSTKRRTTMKKINEKCGDDLSSCQTISNEEKNRLEAVQREWRLSRPKNQAKQRLLRGSNAGLGDKNLTPIKGMELILEKNFKSRKYSVSEVEKDAPGKTVDIKNTTDFSPLSITSSISKDSSSITSGKETDKFVPTEMLENSSNELSGINCHKSSRTSSESQTGYKKNEKGEENVLILSQTPTISVTGDNDSKLPTVVSKETEYKKKGIISGQIETEEIVDDYLYSDDDNDSEQEKPIDKSPGGRFLKFDEELGRGSFKTVYRGLDTETGVAVAWCELQENKLNKQERQRFREEAVMLKGLQHSNIVKFYDYWESHSAGKNKYIVLVTELMTSGTLKLYIKRFKTISIKILKSWCRQILRGLNFLHTRNPPVIHRDLKCDNIFITGTTGSVKIGDLGLATLKNKSHAKSVIGTPEFMAPEMYDEMYDEAVDVYAFGMCLLEMVTGEYPYAECDFPAQIYKKVTSGVKPECFYKIPEEYAEVKDIIDKCIRLNKEERMTIAQLMAHDFFAADDQYGIRVEIKNRDEELCKDSTSFQMQMRIIDPKKRKEYKFNEHEGLQFTFDYLADKVEDVVDQMIDQHHIPESDRKVLIKKLKDKVDAFRRDKEFRKSELKNKEEKKKQEEKEETNEVVTNFGDINDLNSQNDSSKQINRPIESTDSHISEYPNESKTEVPVVTKTVKKGRFGITTTNVPSATIDQSSTSTRSEMIDDEKKESGCLLLDSTDQNNKSETLKVNQNEGVSKGNSFSENVTTTEIEIKNQSYAEPVIQQLPQKRDTKTEAHVDVPTPETSAAGSRFKVQPTLGAPEPMTIQNIQNSTPTISNKNVNVDLHNPSKSANTTIHETPIVIQEPESEIYVSKDIDSILSDEYHISQHEDENNISKHANTIHGSVSQQRPTPNNSTFQECLMPKDHNSSIHDLELELRKLSGVCGVKLEGDDDVHKSQIIIDNSQQQSSQRCSEEQHHNMQQNQSNIQTGQNTPMTQSIIGNSQGQILSSQLPSILPIHKEDDNNLYTGFTIKELSYLLNIAQQQITLQQQLLLAAIEGRSSFNQISEISSHNNNCYHHNNHHHTNPQGQGSIKNVQNQNVPHTVHAVTSTHHQAITPKTFTKPGTYQGTIDGDKNIQQTLTNSNNIIQQTTNMSYQPSGTSSHLQTPSISGNIAPDLADLNDKLQALCQTEKKSGEDVIQNFNNTTNIQHNEITNQQQEWKNDNGVPPNNCTVTASYNQKYTTLNSNNTSTGLQTLDGLAQALKNVINCKGLPLQQQYCDDNRDDTCRFCKNCNNKSYSSTQQSLNNPLPQEVEDALAYQNSINLSRDLPSCLCRTTNYLCHPPEHYTVIDADINIIQKEIDSYKNDKLVIYTLEKHKKELLELRSRQCLELREMKHISSLMALRTNELLKQLNIEKDDNTNKNENEKQEC
ncbi:Protein kinase domain and Serine/threonine-/dual specificity protein kinase, catalytic domain and Protein kinase-like domain and Serine/threonine-protein kinase OSR1/WNK, CCT domain-containing protein [Strongyloides ratti]|uniref:non-specific serine/threonine protein kinase n=1 Tax=Strongyloides ratti TaxID=34506 RepID=A0A090LDB7_STRRB|nr:Protein kinase domain and Serine/threonine-/dual specificity protein kinase, catalytic domain and Protein kinase-like domain and Serine/threonine-protein kinase OSR1/WNK, CCT domain-containing protein [Strongyloides ratti]CEF67732.1 Protein kinase domain and Serine/threonine-/dual specificity protein kinase, catalytic domain and Protein kinase-like domain and Serine/threonine-protein kinase OSR1/WNK, CCT domain-containing protein [Strongyloides ratti]